MALKGSLIDMSLVDLIQAFGMSAKTGRLMLEKSNNFGGILWILNGTIANAATMDFSTRTPQYTGEAAAIEMLQWEDANFRYLPAGPNENYQRTITRSNEWLILEGLRRRDEQEGTRIYSQISMDTRLRMVTNPYGATKTLNWTYTEMQVLKHSAKAETIRQVVEATNYPESEVFAIIGRLMALRLIELEPEEQAPEEDYSMEMITPFVAVE